MKRWGALLLLMVMALAACGQPSDGASAPSATSTITTSDTAAPTANISSGAEADSTATPESAGQPQASGDATTTAAPGGTATGEFDCGDTSRLDNELNIFSWPDYWPIDDDNNLFADFEAACGVKVTLDLYSSNEDLAAKLRAGNSGYDIVLPSDYMVDILAREGLLLKLDKAALPNLANIDPNQLALYFDPQNEYSVPYQYGMTGIAFNSAEVQTAPTSWAALFEPEQLEPYQNRVSMLDDERESVGAALKYRGQSYNATEAAALEQAKELLLQQKPFLARYDSDAVSQGLSSGEIVIAHAWNGAASLARVENPAIEWIVPEEGGVIWQDNLAIPVDAPHPYTAHVFINNVLDGKIGARITDFTYYLTPNTAAEPLVSEEVRALQFYPDDEMRKRLEYIERKGDPALYGDVWTQVKGE